MLAQPGLQSAIGIRTVTKDGRPLPNVSVEGTSGDGIVCKVTTDGQGFGSLRGCGSDLGTLHISAHLQGYVATATDICVATALSPLFSRLIFG